MKLFVVPVCAIVKLVKSSENATKPFVPTTVNLPFAKVIASKLWVKVYVVVQVIPSRDLYTLPPPEFT
jgi:hypothetical protein